MIDPLSSYWARRAGQHGPLMLMYHSVAEGDGSPDWPWAVSMQRFRSQLDYLHGEGWSTPTMAELVAVPSEWPTRAAIITFDDGYTDNVAACEELDKRGMKATLFMVSGAMGCEPSWPADGRPQGRLLNAMELRELHSAGIEIGSHTVSHARLTGVDDTQLHTELTDSKSMLQEALGTEVSSFAYPYGGWDARCANAVRDAGYRAACTTRPGWTLRDGDPFQLRRLTVFNTDTLASFARKLTFASNDVRWSTLADYALRRLLERVQRKGQG